MQIRSYSLHWGNQMFSGILSEFPLVGFFSSSSMATKASCSLVLLKCTACHSKVACRDFSNNNEGKKTKTEDNVNLDDYEGLMPLGVKDVRMSRRTEF